MLFTEGLGRLKARCYKATAGRRTPKNPKITPTASATTLEPSSSRVPLWRAQHRALPLSLLLKARQKISTPQSCSAADPSPPIHPKLHSAPANQLQSLSKPFPRWLSTVAVAPNHRVLLPDVVAHGLQECGASTVRIFRKIARGFAISHASDPP